jgi:hypothetical protein
MQAQTLMQAQTVMQAQTGLETAREHAQAAREHALLARFGELDPRLQELILRHMYALERAEHYRARRLGFRFAGCVSEPLEHELYDAVERWWINRNHAFCSRVRESLPAIEQRLQTCLRAVVGEVFTLHGADELNLSAADWRSAVGSLRMAGPIRSGGLADDWLDQVNACTADCLHHVSVRTLRRVDDYSDDSSSADSSDEHGAGAADAGAPEDRRVLRVIYGGPQRFETHAAASFGGPHAASACARIHGRVDQVLVAPQGVL